MQSRKCRGDERAGRARHPFEPAKLLAGLVLLAAGLVSVLDATGAMDGGPGVLLLPAVVLGLCGAGCVGALTYGVRRRHERRRDRELSGAPEKAPL